MSWSIKDKDKIIKLPVERTAKIKSGLPASHMAKVISMEEYRKNKAQKVVAPPVIINHFAGVVSASLMAALVISFFLTKPEVNRGIASVKSVRVIAEGGNVKTTNRRILKSDSLYQRFVKYLEMKRQASEYKGF